jgi:hypothetical protein
VEGRRNRH